MTDKQFSVMQEQFAEMQRQINSVQQQIKEVDNRLSNKIDTVKKELSNKIDTVKKELSNKIAVEDSKLYSKLSTELFELKQLVKDRADIDSRKNQNIIDLVETRYQDLDKRVKEVRGDIDTVNVVNKHEHEVYNKILNIDPMAV